MPRAAPEPLYCSFCGKNQHEVYKLIAGPGIFICNECVDLCSSIVHEKPEKGTEDKPQDREAGVEIEDKLELRVWLRLLTCANLIEGGVRKRLRGEFATTLPRFDVLAQLDRAPEGLIMGELSSRLMVSNGNVTGLIDRLVQEGLVSRAAKSRDRRTQLVKLTAKGKRAFDDMAPAHAGWIGRMLAGLDREEMADLLQLLGKLKQSLNRMDEDGHRT